MNSTSHTPSGADASALEVERGVAAIRYMREHDCDFLTVANVQDYGQVSETAARDALILEMGARWFEARS